MDKAAFIIYLVTLILSPLLFGAVHTYAYTIMALGVLSATLLLIIRHIRKDRKSEAYWIKFPNNSLNVLFLSFLAFLILQVVGLPDFFLEILSPRAMEVGEKTLPASLVAMTGTQGKDWFALSPYYYPVRMSIIRFAVYGLFFLGLTQVLNSQKRIELTIFLILITGCFEALYGLIQTYSGPGHIWWYKKEAYLRDVTGTYINRNHFAGFMEMGLLLAACYAAGISLRRKRAKTVSNHKRSFRGKLSRFLTGEHRLNKRTLILFAGVVMGIGLIFSASRGGMLGAAGGMLCMGLFFVFRKDYRQKGFILLLLFFITSVYAIHIGVEYPIERFKTFYSTLEERDRFAEKTMDMFQDYRLSGVGVGNFQHGYPKYQAAEDRASFIRHAHNDWAQFLAEAGIMGIALLLAGISYYLYRTMRLWRRRKDPFAVCLGVAPLAAMAAIAIHSYSDFNLHIPANFLMLVAVVAIGYSAIHLERHRGGDITLHRYHILPIRYKGALVLLLTLGLIFWTGFWTIRHFVAEAYCNTVTNSTLNRDQNPSLEEIKKAISWDPWNAEYRYKLGREMVRMRDAGYAKNDTQIQELRNSGIEELSKEASQDEGSMIQDAGSKMPDQSSKQRTTDNGQRTMQDAGHAKNDTQIQELRNSGIEELSKEASQDKGYRIQDQIVSALEDAVRLNPFRAEYHARLAWEYAHLWRDTDDPERWLSAADISMERAAYFAGEKNPGLHVSIGNYWVVRSKTMFPSEPEWEAVWGNARRHYKKALDLAQRDDLRDEIEQFVRKFYPGRGWPVVPIIDQG
jgi:O-antigen ligase